MKVFNKNMVLIYENNLTGENLRKHWATELGLGYAQTEEGNFILASGSLIQAVGLRDLASKHQDVSYVIELAARRYGYTEPMRVKPYEIIWGEGIMFTELELGEETNVE